MGGAKCSYKNCTVRSESNTHMFHYPVLDRPRCHQWLINSNKYDYLNLTVSQLKNRRICHHHFKIDDFMNERMTKIKSNAIPTVDGPYCDLSKLPDNNSKKESFDSVVFEDIENLKIPGRYLEKDAYSKRYSNFLTDSDMVEEEPEQDNKVVAKQTIIQTSRESIPVITPKARYFRKAIIKKPIIEKEIDRKVDTSSYRESKQLRSTTAANFKKEEVKSDIIATKIQILSEEKLSDPVPVGPLKPVKPNTILSVPNKKNKNIDKTNKVNYDYTVSFDDKFNIIIEENTTTANKSPQPVQKEVEMKKIEIEIPPPNNITNMQNETLEVGSIIDLTKVDSSSILNLTKVDSTKTIAQSNKSLLNVNASEASNSPQSVCVKNPETVCFAKINPTRAKAIEKKRNFNKRLRDMISFQMDLASLTPTKGSSVVDINTSESKQNKTPSSTVKHHLSDDKSLPNIQSYNTLAAIETRMKHMEELMLTKIEHNTQTIVNLKKSVEEKCLKKYCEVAIQTNCEELTHKKYLYSEISKYLSAQANSLIYEELFINKFVTNVPKRRKAS